MKQKNDLFEELNINPKNRDVCSPFAVDIQAIKRNVNRTLDGMSTGHSIPHIQKGRLSL